MGGWHKLITSGSDASLNSLDASQITISEINGIKYRIYSNNNVQQGTSTLATISTSDGYAAHFDYLIRNNTNVRAGKIVATWYNSDVQYTDTSTVDIGNTSSIAFTMRVDNNTNVLLEVYTQSGGWTFKSDCKII